MRRPETASASDRTSAGPTRSTPDGRSWTFMDTRRRGRGRSSRGSRRPRTRNDPDPLDFGPRPPRNAGRPATEEARELLRVLEGPPVREVRCGPRLPGTCGSTSRGGSPAAAALRLIIAKRPAGSTLRAVPRSGRREMLCSISSTVTLSAVRSYRLRRLRRRVPRRSAGRARAPAGGRTGERPYPRPRRPRSAAARVLSRGSPRT